MDLGEMLAQTEDLDEATRALAHETVIRSTMAETGEPREIVVDMLGAMQSMGQEQVLALMDGEPTTLRDALSRYVDTLEERGDTDALDTAADLTTILAYPWSAEEERVRLHDVNESLKLDIHWPDDEHLQVGIGGRVVAQSGSYPDKTTTIAVTRAMEETAEGVHRNVLARVMPDRDHHVQLNEEARLSLLAYLERPNGSWRPEGRHRVTLDAVEGGGVLIRTRPWQWTPAPKSRV